MTQVIDFFFDILSELWAVVTMHEILSYGVLITVIGWIVGLINRTEQQ